MVRSCGGIPLSMWRGVRGVAHRRRKVIDRGRSGRIPNSKDEPELKGRIKTQFPREADHGELLLTAHSKKLRYRRKV
jgi:hypothetical protein